MRFGTVQEYVSYYKLLLTDSGRKEFLWWLEKENPPLFVKVAKELKLDCAIRGTHDAG